uniref:DDE Tnp4 domain-containing protein n=1 Tax=Ananas comosus var. bracteatus TaxID=296719 RepID=A0A6V7QHP8_ANACO|nr:unnamed protein product [Ananas comosus var. bracteatus]
MASQKKAPNRAVNKNYNVIDITSTESQSIESHGAETSKTRVRSGNWMEVMDSTMLNLITEEHVLGNFVNGSFTPLSWIRIVHDFNERTKVNFAKSYLQNRLKVLKRQFVMYQTLANKSGWGWDYDRNIPTAGDPNDWDAVVAENPAYSRCRDKPFPAYQDIAFLSGKTTATGWHGFTTGMQNDDIRSTSSSSPGTTAILQQIKNSMAGACGFGQTSGSQHVPLPLSPPNQEGPNDASSYSPNPTPVKSGNPNTNIASADTTSGKRRRSSPPSRKTTPTSTRRENLSATLMPSKSWSISTVGSMFRCFVDVLAMMCEKIHDSIQLPSSNIGMHPKIRDNPLFHPFKNAIGAIDGTHIPVIVKKSKQPRYRCRKGYTSQNMMAACSFDHQFLFICTGWEGSAADMRVLRWCCESGGFMVPEGKFYLVDSGYANTDRFLAPFRGERYHLSQFDNNTRARTHRGPRDLYNHRHAQLRNVVEKAFGILKKRFKRQQGSDIYFNMQMEPNPLEEQEEDPTHLVGIDESRRGDTLRTMITEQLWNSRWDSFVDFVMKTLLALASSDFH